jgi:hypothetical protein
VVIVVFPVGDDHSGLCQRTSANTSAAGPRRDKRLIEKPWAMNRDQRGFQNISDAEATPLMLAECNNALFEEPLLPRSW